MNSRFDDFMLKEYENIATAHFESQKQLAVFFRYYMIFFSVPFLVLSILEKTETPKWLTTETFSYMLVTLAIVGIFFYWFAMEIKYEAVLYAKTVNGIRNYFYQDFNNADLEKQVRTLPKEITKPSYKSFFNPLLTIIILVNSAYLSLAFNYLKVSSCKTIIAVALFVIIHLILNFMVTNRQKKLYP